MTLLGTAADDVPASMTWNAWVSLGTALACLLFVAAYAILAKWWRTYEGKVMMGKAVAIGLLAAYTFIVVEVAPESEVMRWARVVLVAAIGVFMIFQTGRLFINQFNRSKHRRYTQ
jgi:phosphate starvation-inducible membrane PsiE